MSTCIQDTSVWLTGSQVTELIDAGAVKAIASFSDVRTYHNHVTCVYFFDANEMEIAHLTMLSERPAYHSKKWGSFAGYRPLINFERLVANRPDIVAANKYNLAIQYN